MGPFFCQFSLPSRPQSTLMSQSAQPIPSGLTQVLASPISEIEWSVRITYVGVPAPRMVAMMKRQQTITIPLPVAEPAPISKLAVSVEEAAEALGLGKTLTFELINAKRLRIVKLGRKIIIPVTELQAFLEREMGQCA